MKTTLIHKVVSYPVNPEILIILVQTINLKTMQECLLPCRSYRM